MYNKDELKERFTLINNSPMDDIVILDENYKQLINSTYNPDEQKQYLILRSSIKHRLNKLIISDKR